MKDIKRYFSIGSEWLYYKLYMGSKTSEDFLISKLKPLADQLLKDNIIDKWFFINYNDPNRHIRVRFHLINIERDFYNVVQSFNNILNPLTKQRLLSEVVVGTYKRELERYGEHTINEFESLFFHNSELVVNILSLCEDQPTRRWLLGIKAIDFILDDWGADLIYKRDLFESLKSSFGDEMGVNSSINRQLSSKFRTNRSLINTILEEDENELIHFLIIHREKTVPVIERIKNKKKAQILKGNIGDLLKSYIHMHYNRLFSSRQRMNEWVVYYFLHQYYRSKVAQNKQINKMEN